MKFTYPITEDYVQDWGLAHALRELVANAYDAEQQLGAKASIEHRNNKLIIKNEGVVLNHADALYFGKSSKRGDSRYIGQYGEGLKLALLVLARLGLEVLIRNGAAETWRPAIEADKLGVRCLVLDIAKASRQNDDFEVIVNGVNDEAWEIIRTWFLKITPPAKTINARAGQLIDDPDFTGKVFVRGVYVCTRPKYDFGYNFYEVDTGRDRRIPSNYDMDWAIQEIWSEISRREDAAFRNRLFKSFEREAAEQDVFAYSRPKDLVTSMVSEFKETYGETAIPVVGTSEGTEISHLGMTPVPLPTRLVNLLREQMPTPDKVKADYGQKVLKRYVLSDLAEQERERLALVETTLADIIPEMRERTTIVDFGSATVLGLHSRGDVFISRQAMSDFGYLLHVIIHEFAHDFGADGTKQHVDAMQRYTEAVFNRLAGQQAAPPAESTP